MLTVVRALLAAISPALALFGEKDYQQLALIRRMVAELGIDTQVVPVPTVREADGLALSSRNRFLSDVQWGQALALHTALRAVQAHAATAAAAEEAVHATLAAAGIDADYVAVVGEDFTAAPQAGTARILIAARVGDVRLIDNMSLVLGRAAAAGADEAAETTTAPAPAATTDQRRQHR